MAEILPENASSSVPLAVARLGHPPCSRGCPLGTDVKGYVTAAASGRFELAEALARRANPLASTAGRICSRPCEAECTLAEEQGHAVPIRALKAFVCDFVADSGDASLVLPAPGPRIDGASVAVVGAGPAGLAAARDLARAGARVLLLDRADRPGGLLASHVPEFRLPRQALERDVATVLAWGVDFQGNRQVGPGELEGLLASHDAVVLATGAPVAVLPGPFAQVRGSEGLTTAIELLGRPLPDPESTGAVVVGGDPASVAAARSLARSGWRVRLVLAGPEEAASADPLDLLGARADGVEVLEGVTVRSVRRLGRRISGLELAGRSPRFMEAGLVVVGSWRRAAWSGRDLPDGVRVGPAGTLMGEAVEGAGFLVPAGEAALGPVGFLGAVASGRQAARRVLERLTGVRLPPGPQWRPGRPEWLGLRAGRPGESQGRRSARTRVLPPGRAPERDEAASSSEPLAVRAARQCLRCGRCEDCADCSPSCPDRMYLDANQGRLMRASRQGIEGLASLVPSVAAERCIACGRCEEVCPYGAARVLPDLSGWHARIQEQGCRGCGQCVAVCPTGALESPVTVAVPEARVVVFHCNGGALAEEPIDWPEGVCEVLLPCTGMVRAVHLLRAVGLGADQVVVASCESCRFPAPHHGCPALETARTARELLELAGSPARIETVVSGPGPALGEAVQSALRRGP